MKPLLLILVLFTFKTFACDCIGESTVGESIRGSELVAVGTIVNKDLVTVIDSELIKLFHPDTSQYKRFPYSIIIARFKVVVEQFYKGRNSSDTIMIYTGRGGGDCGYTFKIGDKYIIYGQKHTYLGQINNKFNYTSGEKIYWTSACTRTTTFNEKELEEIKTETKIKLPTDNSSFSLTISTYNHAEQIFNGTLTYTLNNNFLTVSQRSMFSKFDTILFSKIIEDRQLQRIKNISLIKLKDIYFNYCIMETSGTEYFISTTNGTIIKKIQLHHYYNQQIESLISQMNISIPEKFKIDYISADTKQDCEKKNYR